MSKKYYFDIPYIKKYETIWYGYLEFDKKIESFINNISDNISLLNEVITEITNISFYINIEDNKIYLSVEIRNNDSIQGLNNCSLHSCSLSRFLLKVLR